MIQFQCIWPTTNTDHCQSIHSLHTQHSSRILVECRTRTQTQKPIHTLNVHLRDAVRLLGHHHSPTRRYITAVSINNSVYIIKIAFTDQPKKKQKKMIIKQQQKKIIQNATHTHTKKNTGNNSETATPLTIKQGIIVIQQQQQPFGVQCAAIVIAANRRGKKRANTHTKKLQITSQTI